MNRALEMCPSFSRGEGDLGRIARLSRLFTPDRHCRKGHGAKSSYKNSQPQNTENIPNECAYDLVTRFRPFTSGGGGIYSKAVV